MRIDNFMTIPAPGRRVVTGVNESGQSIIASDGPVPKDATWSHEQAGLGGDIWIENNIPVDLNNNEDTLGGYTMQEWPNPGGVIARMNTWKSGFEYPMHRSNTLDFVWVISGQIELILEGGSTILKPGDTVVQRGTQHGWRVVGDEPCTFVGVLLDATPPESNEESQ